MISKIIRQRALHQYRSISTFHQASYESIANPQQFMTEASLMVEQPWTTTPFLFGTDLQLPVYNLIDGEFTGEMCLLDPKNFNNPLRRDIVSKVFHYFNVKGVKLIKTVMGKGDVAGSGKKPAPQKGRGAARIGNKRAPQRKNGGKAHGPVPRDLTEKINGKLRLKAIQIMLSAKLYEDRIVLLDSESIEYAKTKYLQEILKPYMSDKITFLTGFEADVNFTKAAQNLSNVRVKNPQEFNINDMLKSDLIFMTK